MAQTVEDVVAAATARHKEGRIDEAEPLYRQALAADQDNQNAVHGLALLLLQSRRTDEAVGLLGQAVQRHPDDAALIGNLATALASSGRLVEAADAYRQAIALTPDDAASLSNLGYILNALNRSAEAIEQLQKAVALKPESVEANINLGIALLDGGRTEEALQAAESIVAAHPDIAEGHNLYGLTLGRLGRDALAIAAFERALRIRPDSVQTMNNLGNAHLAAGRHLEAAECYRRALALAPTFVLAHFNYAVVLNELGSPLEAVLHCRAALERDSRHVGAWNTLGRALNLGGRPAEALLAFERALTVEPDYVPALAGKGCALAYLDRPEEAREAYEQALARDPTLGQAAGECFRLAAALCDWRDFDAKRDDLAARARSGGKIDPLVALRAFDDPPLQAAIAGNWAPPARRPKAVRQAVARHRLRIAYLSADFRNHPVAFQAAGLFERHDRSRFETFGICIHPNPPDDTMRSRLTRAFDHFVAAGVRNDDAVATLLANRQIDIAVDLTGHTRLGRPGIFAYRPVPLAVSFLGFPGSMGMGYYDYLIADAGTVPEACEADYAEKIARLPFSFMPAEAPDCAPCTRAAAGLPESGFVFCAFANPDKLTPDMFAIWMRLLAAKDDSVLWLNVGSPRAQANLRSNAEAAGIAPERLIFAERMQDRAGHLARLACADLFLDTFPYGGHATASDMLAAGVPVLTYAGRGFASRVAAGMLGALGLDDLITDSLESYEAAARALSVEPGGLAEIRAKVADPERRAKLFDPARLCRDLETAYRAMWEIKASGQPARSFTLPNA